jgi:hypothetical protein
VAFDSDIGREKFVYQHQRTRQRPRRPWTYHTAA